MVKEKQPGKKRSWKMWLAKKEAFSEFMIFRPVSPTPPAEAISV